MKHLNVISSIAAPTLALLLPFLTPSSADACGGTFCDQGPNTMPVDQTGENILFKIGPDYVEAHIQIQYDPNTTAQGFAWVIPVSALPEFEVGSQLLFDNMLNGSVPRYGNNQTGEFCGGGGTGGGEEGDSGDGDGDPSGEPNGDPEIVFQGSVGAFELAVLDGGTVEGVMQWLGDNGYQQDPAAEPLLASYLDEDFMFVALKLAVDTTVDELHPIVIRYAGDEPCVPIRLTQIAASDNMDIRVFFLDDARVVPVNYRHVLVNPLKINWFNNASNYKEVISMAVDAQAADGNAFVTEYAGTSSVISMAGVYDASWDPAPFAALVDSPVGAIELLEQMNLIDCTPTGADECLALHPLIAPVLAEFIPPPASMMPMADEFYDCLECYVAMIDLTAWDAAAFSARLDERIFKPGQRAQQLVEDNLYLTRMYTTISPSEMNADPIFRSNATLPTVTPTRISSEYTDCDGNITVTLPDGREIYFPAGTPRVWPNFSDEMPWEEDVDQSGNSEDAPLINLVDNTDLINELLTQHNQAAGPGSMGPDGTIDLGGCGCSTEEGQGPGGFALGFAALGLLGFVRRRRQS